MKLRHYRNVWRGDLPASIPMVKRYLLSMAGLVDVKLIQSRLNAICRWHRDNAHPDPGADVYVRGILRGIVKVHRFDHEPVQDARTLTFVHLEQICDALEERFFALSSPGAQETMSCASFRKLAKRRGNIAGADFSVYQ